MTDQAIEQRPHPGGGSEFVVDGEVVGYAGTPSTPLGEFEVTGDEDHVDNGADPNARNPIADTQTRKIVEYIREHEQTLSSSSGSTRYFIAEGIADRIEQKFLPS